MRAECARAVDALLDVAAVAVCGAGVGVGVTVITDAISISVDLARVWCHRAVVLLVDDPIAVGVALSVVGFTHTAHA